MKKDRADPNKTFTFNVILPAILLSFFLSFSGTLLLFLRDSIWGHSGFLAEDIQRWKVVYMYPSASFGGLLIILLSLKYNVKKMFILLCGFFALVFLFLAIFFISYFEAPPVWLTQLTALASSFWGPLAILIYWGFLNDHFNLKQAGKWYVFFASIPMLGAVCAQFAYVHTDYSRNDPKTFLITALFISFLFSLASIGIAFLAYKRTEARKYIDKETQVGLLTLRKKSYLFFLAVLFSASSFVVLLLRFDWKRLLVHLFQDKQELALYLQGFGEHSLFVTLIFLIGVVLVPLLFRFWGWSWLASLAPCILLILALLFYGLYFWGAKAIDILDPFGNDPTLMAFGVGSAYLIFQKHLAPFLWSPLTKWQFYPFNISIVLQFVY